MSTQGQQGLDASQWIVSVFESYGTANPDRVHRVSGWNAMVQAVRLEIEQCGQRGDESAQDMATYLLAWIDHHYRMRDYSLKRDSFYVGSDVVCVQLCEPTGGAT